MNQPRHPHRSSRRPARLLAAAAIALATAVSLGAAPARAAETLDDTTTTVAPTTTTIAPTPPVTTAPPTTAPTTVPPTATPSVTPTTAPVPATTVAPGLTTSTTTVPPAAAPRNVPVLPSQIANILATIRYIESRGNYLAPPNKGNASGAYQFIGSTWNGYGGYSAAYLAPPEVQDERAALDVNRFLAQWNNDVSMIPVMWYFPKASQDPSLLDIVPVPQAGNVLTVREYQQRWLGVWAFLSGQPIPRQLTLGEAIGRLGVPPQLPAAQAADPNAPADERKATITFPVIGPTRVAAPECGDAANQTPSAGAGATAQDIEAAGLCAEEAPGIIFGVKLQPVLSVVDGVVTDVHDLPGETISVTVTDTGGRSYTLAGFNDDNPGTNDDSAPAHLRLTALAKVGAGVRAGQILGFMGDSSPLPLGVRSDVPTDRTITIATDSVAPHIRLTIEDLDGTPVDAYGPVIDALFRQVCSIGIGPWSVPPSGELHDLVTIETTDDNRAIDSQWVILPNGQVTAAGWAAMVYPSESCGWAPEQAYGPSAGGSPQVPPTWSIPLDLPTPIWIQLARRSDSERTLVPLLRP
jgi:hypothetical protein